MSVYRDRLQSVLNHMTPYASWSMFRKEDVDLTVVEYTCSCRREIFIRDQEVAIADGVPQATHTILDRILAAYADHVSPRAEPSNLTHEQRVQHAEAMFNYWAETWQSLLKERG